MRKNNSIEEHNPRTHNDDRAKIGKAEGEKGVNKLFFGHYSKIVFSEDAKTRPNNIG